MSAIFSNTHSLAHQLYLEPDYMMPLHCRAILAVTVWPQLCCVLSSACMCVCDSVMLVDLDMFDVLHRHRQQMREEDEPNLMEGAGTTACVEGGHKWERR